MCDLCNQWNYRIWIKLTKNVSKKLEKDTFPWLSNICQKEILFQNLTSKELKNILNSSKISLATQNTYINKLSSKSKELLKIFCQVRQVESISESKIIKAMPPIESISLLGYNIDQTTTE